ncbi:MAG: VWA domain-containing protein [Deltaproteobacteria bacterium]|nr:MAG: VWA domain-containing protein [Deltaproteobacteria bacterium]
MNPRPDLHAHLRRAALPVLLCALALWSCGESLSEGRAPDLVLTPNPMQFASVPPGEEIVQTLTVRNAGTGTLRIERFTWAGMAEEFRINRLDPFELEAGEERQFGVVYAPVTGEAGEATLRFEGNVPDGRGNLLRLTTGGDSSRIQVQPNPIRIVSSSFGERTEIGVTVENIGNRAFEVTEIETFVPTAGFEILEAPELSLAEPLELAPGGRDGSTFSITLGYTPADVVSVQGELILRCTAQNCVSNRFVVPIEIDSLAGEILAEPDPVQFGAVPYDAPQQETLTITNVGAAELGIEDIWLRNLSPIPGAPATPADARIVSIGGEEYDRAASSRSLDPGDAVEIVLEYAPRVADPDSRHGLQAEVVLISNDPFRQPEGTVFVGGSPASPVLVIDPPDIDFGIIARGITARRSLRFQNVGSAELVINEICSPRVAQFSLTHPTLTAGPLQDCPGGGGGFGPVRIAPGEEELFTVSFTTPSDAAFNAGYNDLIWISGVNDPRVLGGESVPLTAVAGTEPVCEITFLPTATHNFGQVIRGTVNDASVRARVTGSGPCNMMSGAIQSNFFDILPGFGEFYRFLGTRPGLPQVGLAPGEEVEIDFRYEPRVASAFGDDARDETLIGFNVQDPNRGNERVQCGVQPGGFAIPLPGQEQSICNVRLQGSSGVAELATIPGRFDAGDVTLGCNSQTETITAYSIGNAPVVVESISLEGCDGRFQLAGVPLLPRQLDPQQQMEIQVRYTPRQPDDDGVTTSCRIAFTGQMTGGRHIVPLRGTGTTRSRQVDRFTQNSGQDVDILMVVDNSGSMGNLQNSFRQRIQSFVSRAEVFSSNFQVGVVTTQTEGTIPHDNFSGRREPGELLGDPRIITPQTPNYRTQIQNTVLVGVSNSPESAIERGFESARLALSDPLITDLDEDCSACEEPYLCVDGGCGGFNRGFVRDNASLQIIFFSDEEEQSRGDLDFFVDFFQSIKGMRNTNLFAAHSISGPRDRDCDDGAGSGGADRAPRYVDITTRTGGVWGSICEDFTGTLEAIADIAFQAQIEFYLTRIADPATIEVRVGGTVMQPGRDYRYFPDTNSIVWEEGSIPAENTEFEVEYEARCF